MKQLCMSAGKVIVKHEDHVLWVESLLLRNLGPLSQFYDHTIRRMNGQVFSFIGNAIYTVLLYLSHLVSAVYKLSLTQHAWLMDISCRPCSFVLL